MTEERPPTYQEVLALLRGETMNAFEAEVAGELGQRIVPGWGDSTQLHRTMERSGVTAAFLERCFGEEREEFRRFTVLAYRLLNALPDREEYPPGEEPPEDERSEVVEVLGMGQSFSLLFAQYYRFYKHPDDRALDDWLKYRRVPHRSVFRRELKQVFAAVRKELGGHSS